jgi:hypothetical protein
MHVSYDGVLYSGSLFYDFVWSKNKCEPKHRNYLNVPKVFFILFAYRRKFCRYTSTPNESSEAVYQRTVNTMAKRKTARQTMAHKTLHRKLNIEEKNHIPR